MYAGRVVESGDIRTILGDSRHPYTYALLRSVPDPDAPVTRLLTIPGQPPDLTATVDGCSFAPRCAFSAAECTSQDPPLVPVSHVGSQMTACLRWETAEHWPQWSGRAELEEPMSEAKS